MKMTHDWLRYLCFILALFLLSINAHAHRHVHKCVCTNSHSQVHTQNSKNSRPFVPLAWNPKKACKQSLTLDLVICAKGGRPLRRTVLTTRQESVWVPQAVGSWALSPRAVPKEGQGPQGESLVSVKFPLQAYMKSTLLPSRGHMQIWTKILYQWPP